MWKGLYSRRRSKYLKTWAVIAVVMAALSFSVIAGIVDSGARQPTSPPAQSFLDQFKSNTLSLAALLGALTGIFMFLAKVFKPFKHWFVSWVKKSLEIVDVNKAIDERFKAVESGLATSSQASQKQYAIMSGQNQTLEDGMTAILASLEEINRKLAESENTDRALIRDSITKTFYKYCRRRAIPIHEKENMSKMFDTYKKLGGNSYIASIMKVVDEWDVLSGEDAPSCKV